MTTRALRMKKALEVQGWAVEGDSKLRCDPCDSTWHDSGAKFCSQCGTKLKRISVPDTTSHQLEQAIAYALCETSRLPK